ncbi:hypothetical protein [Capnocytophaga stomatis]|uniref:Uncharacterized protein n=1 Tax=Capnocytophaga stomatis TaxID=1848904 RepID=A0ABW8QDS3_9FLAO|nr:hypothetical protein [Capnocytophaga stomatis]GIJ94226.1 hypothetical protein CAPN002_14440 [Capnocytophaga stomatis]
MSYTGYSYGGEKLTVQLYDYDHFLWYDFLNLDEKIDNPKQVKVKNNRAVIEVYLKPQWKEHIDEDQGVLRTIELYWEVSCEKARPKSKTLPAKNGDYLRVRNDRDIYIKPVMSYTGYSYGVPEVYTFEGEPLPFEEIYDIQAIDKNSGDLFEEYGEGLLISGALYTGDKGLSKAARGIVLSKLEKGDLVTNKDRLVQKKNSVKTYVEYLEEGKVEYKRAVNTGTFVKGETTKGISQIKAMENHLTSSRTLYFIRDTLDVFGNFSSLVDLAKGGKDVNSVAADALGLLVKSAGVAILLSTFAKMTLDIMQTPIKEMIKDWQNDEISILNSYKYQGISKFHRYLLGRQKITTLLNDFSVEYISFQSMQRLLNGTIKKWKDLQYAYDEVAVLYINKGDYSIIDSFFVNAEKIK